MLKICRSDEQALTLSQDYRHNKIERARITIAKSYGVPVNHWEVDREMREIKEKFDAENAGGGKHKWYEIVTGPRMLYRTLLGVALQALQQLTGKTVLCQGMRWRIG